MTHRVALGSMVRWRTWLTTRGRAAPGKPLESSPSGELLQRAVSDVDAARGPLGPLGAALAHHRRHRPARHRGPDRGAAPGRSPLRRGRAAGRGLHRARGPGAGADAEAEARWRGLASAATADLVVGLAELAVAGTTRASLEHIAELEGRLSRRRPAGGSAPRPRARRRRPAQRADHPRRGPAAAQGAHHGQITTAEAAALSLVAVAGVEPLVGLRRPPARRPRSPLPGRLDELLPRPWRSSSQPVRGSGPAGRVPRARGALAVPGRAEVLDVSLRLAAGHEWPCRLVRGREVDDLQPAPAIPRPDGRCGQHRGDPAHRARRCRAALARGAARSEPHALRRDRGRLPAPRRPRCRRAELREVLELVDLGVLRSTGPWRRPAPRSGGQRRRLAPARVLRGDRRCRACSTSRPRARRAPGARRAGALPGGRRRGRGAASDPPGRRDPGLRPASRARRRRAQPARRLCVRDPPRMRRPPPWGGA